MNRNNLISLFVVLALCFGQLASYTHVLSHVSMPLQADDHAELGHEHHSWPSFYSKATVAHEAADEKLDCSIYHLFPGSNCLGTMDCDVVAAPFECVVVTVVSGVRIPVGIAGNSHIRGPPQLS